jgi:ABC-type dipeptide/oligopeptide/nickel transport system ATPase subunit
MSTLLIQRIEAKAFKAFKHLDFKLDGRNLLVYGANGSGKSSLYWTLYTFLQSAQKEPADIAKYFDKDRPEHLLNLNVTDAERALAAITVTFQNEDASICPAFTLSLSQHGTQSNAEIRKGCLASDFVTYRILFNFYHFRNSQPIDLWPVFESEILAACRTTSGADLSGLWSYLKGADPYGKVKQLSERGAAATKRYNEFDELLKKFKTALSDVLATITIEAQKFYDLHFKHADVSPIQFGVVLRNLDTLFDRAKHSFDPPEIGFEIRVGNDLLPRPHTLLNEAKLTQLALSIRFGATFTHLHDSPLKLLVLDDLLISIDMENRMKVVEIFLSDIFSEYQKVILTHDLGFFNEFRRRIGGQHIGWSFQHFKNSSTQTGSTLREAKSDIQKAEDYLHGQSLDEAATCLRKAADNSAKRLREWLSKEKLPPGEFFSLTENLRESKKRLLLTIPKQLYEKILKETPLELLQKLIPNSVAELNAEAGLEAAERRKINSKRGTLRKLLTDTHWVAMENVRLIDEVLATTERVLNPGAHGGESPLYEAEVQKALDLVRQLEALPQG